MGMLEPGATPLILMSVFKDIHPDYVIATGIAFGRKSKGHNLGDILVSRQLVNYESRKEVNGDIIFRGDKVTSSMLGRINAAIHNWKGATVHQGVVLSGNALVNSKEFLEHLAKREPEYVGGDMESYGVYAVASMMGAQWIMIKGISDWGDGSKNDNFHKLALENVGKFIFYTAEQGNLK
jgi:nucleoside phosphorylase